MKIIKESDIAIVYDDGDKIVKKFKDHLNYLDIKWWNFYDDFYNQYKISPKVYDIVPHKSIVMEKVTGLEMKHVILNADKSINNIHKQTHLDCFKIIQEIKFFMADFSRKHNIFCLHTDISVDNILMNSADSYYLIDIDSIRFDWGLHMYQYNTAEGWIMGQLLSHKIGKR